MNIYRMLGPAPVLIVALVGSVPALEKGSKDIVHDAEYYVLDAQHGEEWAADDKELAKRLAAMKKKYGRPSSLIYIMWDDTPFGDVGVPAIQKVRSYETLI